MSVVAIRCDGDETVGAGHVARCLPIARALAEHHEVTFVGRYAGLAEWLLEGWACREPDPAAPAGVVADAALVDSYAIPEAELCALASAVPVATVAEARRCPGRGVWIDYHVDRLGEEPTATVLPGPRYAPVDARFAGAGRPGHAVRRALVTVGGSAPARALVPTLARLLREAFGDVRLVVASGAGLDLEDVEELPFPGSLLDAVGRVDVAVSAAGLTAYELACAGVPALVVPVAENQRRVAAGCAEAGVALAAEPEPAALAAALDELRDDVVRTALTRTGQAVFDGQGATRAAAALLDRWSLP